jgi:aryl-alcohol dehydrogenase-like predicted oxidoreductase
MKYRNLGRTGVRVSPLCLGCMNFGGRTDEKDGVKIIDAALEAGINFVDTANVYHHGESEKVVGKALDRDGKREKVVLATKVHGTWDEDDPNGQGNSRRHIIEQVEGSLDRLKTDWIDLYQIHRPMGGVAVDETLRALDDLIRSGKVRYVGTSTFAAWQLMEAIMVARDLGLNRFVCEQPPYNPLDRRIERELVPFAQTYGTALIPWSPLAGGFMTGKYSRDGEWPDDGRLSPDAGRGAAIGGRAFDVVETVEAIAKDAGCTPSQWSLAWCASQPGITSPIIGPRTMEQLEDNLGALEVTVTGEQLERLDEVSAPGGVVLPFYEADFGPQQYR